MNDQVNKTVRDQKPISGESLAEQMKRATESGALTGDKAGQGESAKPLPKRWYPYGPTAEKK